MRSRRSQAKAQFRVRSILLGRSAVCQGLEGRGPKKTKSEILLFRFEFLD
jgi:hypothetical protein